MFGVYVWVTVSGIYKPTIRESVVEAADIIIPNKLQHGKRALVPGQRDPMVPESIIHNKHSIFQINYTPGPNLSSFSGGHCGTATSDFALTRFIWVMLILCLLLCFVHPACFLAFISASCSPCLCLQLYTDWNGTVRSFCLPCPLWYLYYCVFHYNNCFQGTLCQWHVWGWITHHLKSVEVCVLHSAPLIWSIVLFVEKAFFFPVSFLVNWIISGTAYIKYSGDSFEHCQQCLRRLKQIIFERMFLQEALKRLPTYIKYILNLVSETRSLVNIMQRKHVTLLSSLFWVMSQSAPVSCLKLRYNKSFYFCFILCFLSYCQS